MTVGNVSDARDEAYSIRHLHHDANSDAMSPRMSLKVGMLSARIQATIHSVRMITHQEPKDFHVRWDMCLVPRKART